jgi:hypothetical protein
MPMPSALAASVTPVALLRSWILAYVAHVKVCERIKRKSQSQLRRYPRLLLWFCDARQCLQPAGTVLCGKLGLQTRRASHIKIGVLASSTVRE